MVNNHHLILKVLQCKGYLYELIMCLVFLRYAIVYLFQLNTQLLKDKKNWENRISILKEGIASEKRNLNKADYNAKKNQANCNTATDMYNEAHKKSVRLQN